MNTQVDIIDILGSISVPTLIMQRTHDIDVKIEEGKFIADRIPNSKFVELQGSDHLFWVGNTEEVMEEMTAFILNTDPKRIYEQQLLTIVIGRFCYEQDITKQELLISQYVSRYRGKMVHYNSQSFTAVFEGPSKAVHCGIDLVDAMQALNVKMTVGIHIKECSVSESVSNETEQLVFTMLKNSYPGQIILTQTVKSLSIGAGVNFIPYKTIFEPKTGEPMILFNVADKRELQKKTYGGSQNKLPHNDSFLENVLQSIDNNLSNESYGVETLSQDIGIGERQLQRKLKAITNKSPNQLISSVRLHRAKELLLTKPQDIAEVAFKTGFSNPSYFSKSFKIEFGISPSELSVR
jgi:AraC-like DNA-binding protein